MTNKRWARLRMSLLGRNWNDGVVVKMIVYLILISISVLYLKPVLYMMSTSLKDIAELVNPNVMWLPTHLVWGNYNYAITGLQYWKSLSNTAVLSVSAAALQMVSCALTGYAFARMQIPFKNLLFAIVLVIFLIPPQTLVIPLFVMYSKFKMLNSPLPFLIPALFAQGLKGSLFIIIFRQFFTSLPKELEESARMDGAGPFRTYFRIMLPLARPAMLIVFLFSFVWHWNDYFEPNMFLRSTDFLPLSISMTHMQANLNYASGSLKSASAVDVTAPLKMAAAILIILPPLIVYMFAQRYFVEGIERTGLVE